MHAPRIFLSAGEASGDHYGAELIAALRETLPHASFTGLGGTAMAAAGQHRVIRAEDVAVMGITEILRHIPRILASYRTLVRSIRADRPDVAVLIDFPDVNFRLAKHLERMGVPVIWFVSPQLWAWKRRRLRWVQSRISKMLTIFPFEAEFYRARGVDADFVGHPLAEAPLPTISREDYAAQATNLRQNQWLYARGLWRSSPLPDWAVHENKQGIRYPLDTQKPWIALLPGSRAGEVKAHLSELIEAALQLGPAYEYLIPVAPTISIQLLDEMQAQAGAHLDNLSPPRITFVHDARAALLHSRAAVIASGTATVQAAVLGTPFIAVYRVSNTTFRLAKRLVRYPAEIPAQPDRDGNLPVAMPNLIAGRRIVPELLQQNFTAERIVRELEPLLADGPIRDAQIQALREVRTRLLPPQGLTAIQRLRDTILSAIGHIV